MRLISISVEFNNHKIMNRFSIYEAKDTYIQSYMVCVYRIPNSNETMPKICPLIAVYTSYL